MAVYIVGKVSGGHINPAVTFAESVMGNFKWAEVPLYIIAQVLANLNRFKPVFPVYTSLFTFFVIKSPLKLI